MALIYRNGRARYQQSVRRDGRVTTEYRASGNAALLFACLDAESQEEREQKRAEDEDQIKAMKDAEQTLIDHFESVDDLIQTTLEAAGFHEHKSQWRKRREKA
jgi:hypothetical protein